VKLNYSIQELIQMANATICGACPDLLIQQIHIDTRLMHEDQHAMFVCLDAKRAGTDFIPSAYSLGCRTFLVPETYQLDSNFHDACFLKVENTLVALQKISQSHRERFHYPVIGITGSFGKTMVKEWLFHFLQKQYHVVRSPKSYNSQIGVALSVLQMTSEHNLAIFEAGISQIGEMSALAKMVKSNIGLFTGIGNAHNAGFKNQEEKLVEKSLLFENSEVVVSSNYDFSGAQNIHWNDIQVETSTNHSTFQVADYGVFHSSFSHKHKIENLKAILALLKYLNFPANLVQERINSLPQIAMRMELVQGKNNNLFINDAYAMEGIDEALAYLKELAANKQKQVYLGLTDAHYLQQAWFKEILKNACLDDLVLVSEKASIPGTISIEEAAKKIQDVQNAVVLIKGQYGSGIAKLIAPLMQRSHPTVLEINRQALRNNITRFKNQLQAQTKLMVMVKAAAYGVGASEMATFLEREGVDYLGVAFPDEGVNLRKSGVQLPVMVMNTHQSAFLDVIENQLEPAIFSMEQLDDFTSELVRLGISNYPIHIKVETGMNRLGFRHEDLDALCAYLTSQPEVRVQSVYSHLAESGNSDRTFTHRQLDLFNTAHNKLQAVLPYLISRHICNTDGIINYPEAHMNMVRLGIGLLGYAKLPDLEHTLHLSTKISKVNAIKQGESLGYDRSFVAEKNMEIAVLPIGYADGFRRVFGNGRAYVFINEQKCAILGNVCMDMCFVDVSGLNAKAGDEVELIGTNISVYDWAHWAATIPYEIMTSLSSRLNRVWVD
jgi:Alr-MurF fusion protein